MIVSFLPNQAVSALTVSNQTGRVLPGNAGRDASATAIDT